MCTAWTVYPHSGRVTVFMAFNYSCSKRLHFRLLFLPAIQYQHAKFRKHGFCYQIPGMTMNTKLQKIAEIPLTTNELSPVDNQSVELRGWVESLLSTTFECLHGNLKLELIIFFILLFWIPIQSLFFLDKNLKVIDRKLIVSGKFKLLYSWSKSCFLNIKKSSEFQYKAALWKVKKSFFFGIVNTNVLKREKYWI